MKRALLTAVLLLSAASSAHATVEVYPPSNWVWTTGRIHVGRTLNGDMWAVYFTGLSGGTYTCKGAIQIGSNNQLNNNGERHRIHGGSGIDEMLLVGGQITSSDVCGKLLIQFSADTKIELWGDGGNDIQQATVPFPSALVSGGDGDDWMVVGQLAQARGGNGSDRIIGAYPISMYGEGNSDTFCSFSESSQGQVTYIDGGTGSNDKCWGNLGTCAVTVENVEAAATEEVCDDALHYVLDSIAD